jgi:hypothetical protein
MQNFASRRSSSTTYSSNLLKLVAKSSSPISDDPAALRSPLPIENSSRTKEVATDPKILFKDLFIRRMNVPEDPANSAEAARLRKYEFRTLLNQFLKNDAQTGSSKDSYGLTKRVVARQEVDRSSVENQREKISLDTKAILESVSESDVKELSLPFHMGSGNSRSNQTTNVAKSSFAEQTGDVVPANPLRMNSILKTQASINASIKSSLKWNNHKKNVVFAAEIAPRKSDKTRKGEKKEICFICC